MPAGTICYMPGCTDAALARGLCAAHYKRWRVHGDPNVTKINRRPKSGLSPEAFKEWFFGILEVVDGPLDTPCLLWPWKPTAYGYGVVFYQGKNRRAHRVAWELDRGPIPDGMLVCHVDDHNRLCCNPEHLYLGNHKTNAADMMRLGNRFQSPGGRRKLTDADLLFMDEQLARGASEAAIAEALGVHQTTINRSKRRERERKQSCNVVA